MVKNYPTSPIFLYACENFMVRFTVKQNFRLQNLVRDSHVNGVVSTEFFTRRNFDHMTLSDAACRLRDLPNAGGNSVASEVLSFEMLYKCFGARLLKTEMEVEYWPEGGSITDYVCDIFGTKVGVSVTRAMKYRGEFDKQDADRLLAKKLKGIIQSSRNALDKWSKQILHIWATSPEVAEVTVLSFTTIPHTVRSNTLLLVTVADNFCDVFTNR